MAKPAGAPQAGERNIPLTAWVQSAYHVALVAEDASAGSQARATTNFADAYHRRHMDNSFMVGLSAQQVLRQRMDMTANNLANMTTTGFKAERLVMRELSEKPATAVEDTGEVAFVDGWMLQRDFSAGPVTRTGNPLDTAIEGEGFFVVQTDNGEAYTRDGGFTLDAQGQLMTRTGLLVMGDGGPIAIDPEAGAIEIRADGTITQNEIEAGRLRVVAFDTPEALEKLGNNLWAASDEQPRAPDRYRVAGGFLEQSNVNAVLELTEMISISRSYQSVARIISQTDELRATSIDKLARLT